MGGLWSTPSSSDVFLAKTVLQDLERTRIERELAVAQLLEKRRQTYRLAEEREKFWWGLSGGAVTSGLAVLSSFHHKNLLHLLPICPIATYLGYKAHYCYGDKISVINKSASDMVSEEVDSLVPTAITVQEVKNRIEEIKQLREISDD